MPDESSTVKFATIFLPGRLKDKNSLVGRRVSLIYDDSKLASS